MTYKYFSASKTGRPTPEPSDKVRKAKVRLSLKKPRYEVEHVTLRLPKSPPAPQLPEAVELPPATPPVQVN